MLAFWFRIPFWQRVLGAMLLGIGLGVVFGEKATVLQPLGTLFINAIRMLVVPLVFFALITSITSLGDTLKMKRLAVKTVGLFLLTAMIASLIGLTVGSLMDFSTITELTTTEVRERDIPPVATVLTNLIPTNPVAALASGNVLQIIVFAVLVGIAINVVGEKAEPMKKVMEAGAEIMYQITRMVLQLTPIGVLGLMAWVVGSFGLETLLPLGKFILAIYIACFIHIIFTYGGMVRLFGGMSPLAFFKAILPAQLVAFSSASSFGTLPVTHKVVTEDLKVSKNYASFVLPLGATINMDGCGGIYPAIAAIFIAHLYGIPLDATSYLLIAITATLASLGTAGVPGSAMVMLTVTLSVVGLPLEGIAFIAAVDRIIDMMRTATNVTGDTMVARVVARSEGLIESEQSSPEPATAS
ncbi:dicarboxylate/amino acid:cation symporter [Alkalimonas delamerensis]|uniref:Dicarboxylate/amino acid:cation symporter n=2 Tax=Alkalimonas delamerensis TaxID=265981 RepID=A0ABT9GN06_9GAMM|nr:dicarboxylate/amino acid:cation symporter [Alkalimonas delamerensis]MDP4528345.1 dicarboxylate/amino acid:cation symporter [Alkalimonas delamerensis]